MKLLQAKLLWKPGVLGEAGEGGGGRAAASEGRQGRALLRLKAVVCPSAEWSSESSSVGSVGSQGTRTLSSFFCPSTSLSPTRMEALAAYFRACGISETKSLEAAKGKSSAVAYAFLSANEVDKLALSDKQGPFAFTIATAKDLDEAEKKYALDAVVDGRLKATDQVAGESRRGWRPERKELIPPLR